MLVLAFAALTFSLFPEEGVRVVQQYGFLRDWWNNPELSYSVYWYQLPTEKLPEKQRVAKYLKSNSSPGDEIYVWGYASLIYLLAQRSSPSRFMYDWPLIASWGLPQWREEVVRSLETKRPRYIVVERKDSDPLCTHTIFDSEQYLRLRIYPPLTNLVDRQYRPVANYSDFEIFELKDAHGLKAHSSAPTLPQKRKVPSEVASR